MFGRFKKLLLRQPAAMLGMDIGSNSIKLVEITTKKSKKFITAAGIAEISRADAGEGSVDEDSLYSAVRQLMATNKISARDVVATVGSRAAFIRRITFPRMSEQELKEAIKWDVDKYVPYDADSFYYDYALINTDEDSSEIPVLLVATPKQPIDAVISTCKRLGLHLHAIDIDPLALHRTLGHAPNVVVVDIGTQLSHIVVFCEGTPVVNRSVDVSGNLFTETIMRALKIDFSEAEHIKLRHRNLLLPVGEQVEATNPVHGELDILVNELAREIRRTIEYYQTQTKCPPLDKIFLTGGGANLDNLAENLYEQLNIPVVQHNPLATIALSPSLDFRSMQAVAAQLTVAIGLALRGGEL